MVRELSFTNIINIFAVHLGCDVRFVVNGISKMGQIVSVDFIRNTVNINDNNKVWYEFKCNDDVFIPKSYEAKDCKIILKEITNISSEHGKILEEYFLSYKGEDEEIEGWDYDLNAGGFIVYFKKWGGGSLFDIDAELGLLLASLGYDVNIVPDKFKEIVIYDDCFKQKKNGY